MTPEQQAAYIQAQATCALVDALGMMTTNLARLQNNEAPIRLHQDFLDLINNYGIGHNAVICMFTGR